jgi:hypothetical protein
MLTNSRVSMLKIDVFAPRPKARDAMATVVKRGLLRSIRKECLKSDRKAAI